MAQRPAASRAFARTHTIVQRIVASRALARACEATRHTKETQISEGVRGDSCDPRFFDALVQQIATLSKAHPAQCPAAS